MFIKKFVKRLKEYLRKSLPELNICLSVNKRCKFVRLCVDYPLIPRKPFYELISLMKNFERIKLDELIGFFCPSLIHMIHWEHDHIIFELKKLKKRL